MSNVGESNGGATYSLEPMTSFPLCWGATLGGKTRLLYRLSSITFCGQGFIVESTYSSGAPTTSPNGPSNFDDLESLWIRPPGGPKEVYHSRSHNHQTK